jgi:prepilin peptidase CpaA
LREGDMPIVAFKSFLLLALLLLAGYADLRMRRIPNRLTLTGLVAGLAVGGMAAGWSGLGNALLGAVSGFALFFGLYLLRAMGAGDVKLMAAAGSFLGIPLVFSAALYSALAGGVVLLVVAVRTKSVRRITANMGNLLTYWAQSGIRKAEWLTLDSPGVIAVPYGVAIALGCAVTALFPELALF